MNAQHENMSHESRPNYNQGPVHKRQVPQHSFTQALKLVVLCTQGSQNAVAPTLKSPSEKEATHSQPIQAAHYGMYNSSLRCASVLREHTTQFIHPLESPPMP